VLDLIKIDEFSSTPKYRQLANSIIEGIQSGYIKEGDVLPSINEVSFAHYISRITVEKGYNYLKTLGIVESIRGKGFFICVGSVPVNFRIFLLFNKLSVHKKIIYAIFGNVFDHIMASVFESKFSKSCQISVRKWLSIYII
jgi:DNA-binding transcriptional MocR family regulator